MELTRSQIVKAGKKLRKDTDLNAAMEVLAMWKAHHSMPLEKAYREIFIVSREIDPLAIVARREKRARSIVDKLRREPSMSLVKMQDIGGCRAVVKTEKDVRKIASKLRRKRHISSADNYLKKPKADGYRGIHLLGHYDTKILGELLIEFQIRTKIQHAWATAGEITELFTSKSVKHIRGDQEWKSFYRDLADVFDFIQSKFVSRDFDFDEFNLLELNKKLFEFAPSILLDKIRRLRAQEKKLKVKKKFDTYANSLRIADSTLEGQKLKNGYARLHAYDLNTHRPSVQISHYEENDLRLAQEHTYKLERDIGNSEAELVVLLSTQAIGGIREAYPNYFADSMLFMRLMLAIIR